MLHEQQRFVALSQDSFYHMRTVASVIGSFILAIGIISNYHFDSIHTKSMGRENANL